MRAIYACQGGSIARLLPLADLSKRDPSGRDVWELARWTKGERGSGGAIDMLTAFDESQELRPELAVAPALVGGQAALLVSAGPGPKRFSMMVGRRMAGPRRFAGPLLW